MYDPEFSLDRYNLEIESERQADLMRKYTKRQAKMKSLLKKAQKNLDILEGELAERIQTQQKRIWHSQRYRSSDFSIN